MTDITATEIRKREEELWQLMADKTNHVFDEALEKALQIAMEKLTSEPRENLNGEAVR